jgi:NAD(P)H-nitrite reductase large subunit
LEHPDFILVGGGLASATVADTLRTEGAAGSILLLCAEGVRPYHRPPLSKQALLESGQVPLSSIHSEEFYREQRIQLRLNTRVGAVDTSKKTVTTAAGEQIGYDRLLIATGAVPRTPSIPGMTLTGVHTLRSVTDAESIKRDAAQARRAVVLGAAFSAWRSPSLC